MKTTIYTFLMCVCVAILLTGCKKDDDDTITISNEDVSDLVANCLESGVWGVSSQFKESAQLAEPYMTTPYCGYTGDTSLIKNYGGSSIQYSYNFTWNWTMNCTGPVPSSVAITYNSTGNNASSVMKSTFNTTGNFTMTGMEVSSTEYLFDGVYTRNGDYTSKIRESHSCNTVITLTFTDVAMSKTDYIFNSGSAVLDITCTTTDSQTFTFTGTIVFLGNQNCSITINGTTYTVQV